MNARKLVAVVAFAAAPLAAFADAPSGDFDQVFKQEQPAKSEPQFPRSEYRADVEHWLEDQLARNAQFAKSREQVRKELAEAPLEVVGA